MMDHDQLIKSYLNDLSSRPMISRRREKVLSRVINNKKTTREIRQRAINELVEGNLRMVVKMAFQSPNKKHVIDMISDGNMGLILAALRYDANKADNGARFGTYARYWVKRFMYKGFLSRSSKILHVPPNAADDAYTLGKLIDEGRGTSSFLLKTSRKRLDNAQRIIAIRRVSLHNDDGEPIDISDESDPPDSRAARNELYREMKIAMDDLELSEEQREMVMSTYLRPDSLDFFRLLAKKHGVSLSTIKMRKQKILSDIRKRMSKKLGKKEIKHALASF